MFESILRQQTLGGTQFSKVTLNSPLSTHTLPASAVKVPCLGCYCGNSEDIGTQEVNLEQRGIYLLGRWPRSLILEVLKAPKHPQPHLLPMVLNLLREEILPKVSCHRKSCVPQL